MGKRKGGGKYDLRRVCRSWLLPQPLNKSMLMGVTRKIEKLGVRYLTPLFY